MRNVYFLIYQFYPAGFTKFLQDAAKQILSLTWFCISCFGARYKTHFQKCGWKSNINREIFGPTFDFVLKCLFGEKMLTCHFCDGDWRPLHVLDLRINTDLILTAGGEVMKTVTRSSASQVHFLPLTICEEIKREKRIA